MFFFELCRDCSAGRLDSFETFPSSYSAQSGSGLSFIFTLLPLVEAGVVVVAGAGAEGDSWGDWVCCRWVVAVEGSIRAGAG